MKIILKDGAQPYSVAAPRRVPIPLLPKEEKELKRMESMGIKERVTDPTEWCAPMVPVIKKNGNIRICVDLKRLNENVKREKFILPTLDYILPKLAKSTVFSSLDAESGFWQIPLEEHSARLTTFITPLGRYCFKLKLKCFLSAALQHLKSFNEKGQSCCMDMTGQSYIWTIS